MDYNLTLPIPPGVNKMYTRTFKGVRLSDAAVAYKTEVLVCARNDGIVEPLSGDVGISIDVYRPHKKGDLDGYFKLLLDALNGVTYFDDKQIVEIKAKRFDDAKYPRIEVYVWQTESE